MISKAFAAVLCIVGLSGCAVQTLTGQVTPTDFERITVDSGGAPHIGYRVPGTEGVGYRPHVSAAGFIAGAVAAGAVTGSAQLGMALAQIGESGPTAAAGSIKAAEVLAAAVQGGRASVSLSSTPPQNGIFASPSIQLWELEDSRIAANCVTGFFGYSGGAKKWTYYVNGAVPDLLPKQTMQELGGPEFRRLAVDCFRYSTAAFREFATGKYDGKFRGGLLTRTSGGVSGQGEFVKDDQTGVVIQVFTSSSPPMMVVWRASDVKALKLD